MSSSKFTGNDTGSGKSSGIKTSSVPGGKLVTSFPPDTVHGVDLQNTKGGGKFGGSTSNLSHSLRGSSAVQK